jgi:hypothetical protein
MDREKWQNMKTPLEEVIDGCNVGPEELAEAIEAIHRKRKVVIEKEERKARAYRESTLLIQRQIAAKKAGDKAERERMERKAKAILDAKDGEIQAEIKTLAERVAAKKIKDAEREAERKADAKVFDARLVAKKAETAREDKIRREEAHRASKVKTIIERVNRIMSDEDAMYSDLKAFRNPKLANDGDKKAIKKALDAASERCENAKLLITTGEL